MFTLYTVFLTLHITAVVAWVGAGAAAQVIARQSPEAGPPLFRFGEKWFPAASGLAALTGIVLWIDGPWGLGEIWVLIAVVGWVVSSFLGATRLAPSVQRWSEGDQAGRTAFVATAQIDLTILVLIIADMVLKPGL